MYDKELRFQLYVKHKPENWTAVAGCVYLKLCVFVWRDISAQRSLPVWVGGDNMTWMIHSGLNIFGTQGDIMQVVDLLWRRRS